MTDFIHHFFKRGYSKPLIRCKLIIILTYNFLSIKFGLVKSYSKRKKYLKKMRLTPEKCENSFREKKSFVSH